jgi:hypothetical protein
MRAGRHSSIQSTERSPTTRASTELATQYDQGATRCPSGKRSHARTLKDAIAQGSRPFGDVALVVMLGRSAGVKS